MVDAVSKWATIASCSSLARGVEAGYGRRVRTPCQLVERLNLAAALTLYSLPAAASVFIPMSIEELARSSAAVVVGAVARIDVYETLSGAIGTAVTIDGVRTLHGADVGNSLTLRESGGSLGGVTDHVSGAPQFTPGEEVLLFLVGDAGGSFRVNQGVLGKLRLTAGAAHSLEGRRSYDDSTAFILPPGAEPPAAVIVWDDLLARIGVASTSLVPIPSAAPLPRFRITQAGRFFQPDEGVPVDFRLDFNGDSTLGFTDSKAAIDAALAAWTAVDDATVTLRDIGLTNDLGRVCPGPNKVIFDDPESIIAPPIVNPDGNDPGACRGELARGIQRTSRFESKSFNGLDLERVMCGFLILANGWGNCDVWTPCNVAEIATHELGHILGFGHSSDNAGEPNATLRDATMYFRAHFDGRCAALRQDDIDGVRFLYPTALPPTITTGPALPSGLPGVFYSVDLAAIGGDGDFTWSLAGGGFPGMAVEPGGVLSGIPEVHGTSFFQLRATDAQGSSHVKVLNFTAGTPGPLPPTSTPTVTASPTVSTTATSTATVPLTPTPTRTRQGVCSGDCDAAGDVTVDEIVILVNIALGVAAVDVCTAGDRDGSGAITVDEILLALSAALDGCPHRTGRKFLQRESG